MTARALDTRTRILDATGAVLARSGPRKLSLRAIADAAGVSRPTLYKYFGSKEQLLLALAAHEKTRFASQLDEALAGLTGAERLDRALVHMVEFQRDYPLRALVAIEPAFVLDQLAAALGPARTTLVPLFDELARGPWPSRSEDLADLVVRAVVSHFLIPGDDEQLLRELRHIAGLPDPTRRPS